MGHEKQRTDIGDSNLNYFHKLQSMSQDSDLQGMSMPQIQPTQWQQSFNIMQNDSISNTRGLSL